jgi:hypothetical protein
MILVKAVDDFVTNVTVKKYESLCKWILSQNPSCVFLTLLWEAYPFPPALLYIDKFMRKHNIQLTWVVNKWAEPDLEWQQLKSPIVFFDFFLWRSFNEVLIKKKSKLNPKWNPQATRYLFLTGKPDKLQRVRLLYMLQARQLLDNCNYSFFMHAGMWDQTKALLPELTDDEFSTFVLAHQRTIDNIEPLMQSQSMHYGGIPYNHDMYTNSLFRVVSETSMMQKRPWITEKTWLTIANNTPFVIAAEQHSCRYLKSLGIETFDELFDIPSYDDQLLPSARLEGIVDHVEQWTLNNFDKNKVRKMVEHNHTRFIDLALAAKQEFEKSVNYSIDQIIHTHDGVKDL